MCQVGGKKTHFPIPPDHPWTPPPTTTSHSHPCWPGLAWTPQLGPSMHVRSLGEPENSGSPETLAATRRVPHSSPHGLAPIWGPTVLGKASHFSCRGVWGSLTFEVRYLVIISFPFSPSFSSGVTSYSA